MALDALAENLRHPPILFTVGVIMVFALCFAVLDFTLFRQTRGIPDFVAGAATYGSISAVTFATAISFLESRGVSFDAWRVSRMALLVIH